MHKVIQNKLNKSLITLPIFGVIILSFLYINIYVNNALVNSSAVTGDYELSVQNNTTLRIELPTTTPISVTPTVAGQFNSQTLPVNVVSDYVNGYTLTMSASTSSLSRSEAVNGKTYEIPTLASNVDESNNPYTCTVETSESCNFPKNYWGLKRSTNQISDPGYIPLIANVNMPVNITSAPADESISNIDFGVKLSNATPNGTYNITLNFLAVTNVAPNLYYMQDATSTSLAAAMPSVGDTTVLYDRRDGQEYTIAKLKDGKYWMTKNLNLAGGTVLTSDDTDMAPGYTMPTTYVDPDSGATLPTGFGEGNVLPASSKTGFDNNYKAFIYNTGNNTDTCTGDGCYSYYSYNAATLGSGMDIASDDTDAPYSVCPKGWKLPTSRSTLELAKTSSDFYQLAVHYGMNPANIKEDSDNAPTFCSEAGNDCGNKTIPNFLRAGYYYGSPFYGGNAYGLYWSSTASSGTNAHDLNFTSSYVHSAGNDPRGYGFSIRCLFDATMQNFTSEDADAMALHQEKILVDARDGKNYYVTKLKDGNVWMTQNLDLDLNSNVALTNADTDLNSVTSWTPTRSTIDSTSYGNITTCSSQDSAGTGCWGQTNTGFASGWTNDENIPYSDNPGYRYMTFTDRTTKNDYWYSNGDTFANCTTQNTNCGGQGHYMIGNYYNFAAATATNNVQATAGGSANVVQNKVMPDSICPKGWRMPIAQTTNNEFNTLLAAYNITGTGAFEFNYQGLNKVRRDPLYFIRSGYVRGGALYDAGTSSLVWSSTISSSTNGYYLGFNGTDIDPATSYSRILGFAVRCLLRTE